MKTGFMRKLATMAIAVMGVFYAQAATETNGVPTVTESTAKQRYPWNGLVDITCKVSGIDGTTNGLRLAVSAVMPDSGKVRQLKKIWLVQNGTNTTDREVHANGEYRLLWDARAEFGTVHYTNMVLRVDFNVHEKVQLWEGGPYWATTNIGADEPWEYGYYFWWGDTVGYKRENDKWVASDGSNSNFSFDSNNTPTYNKSISTLQSQGWIVTKDGTYVLAPEYDAAQVQWGGEWRMPTRQEFDDLDNKCDWIWTTMNGDSGYVVRGRGSYASNSIFLPSAGYGDGTSLVVNFVSRLSLGRYGTSNCENLSDYDSLNTTWYLYFYYNSRVKGVNRSERSITKSSSNFYLGCSVRPVQGFTK